ncbi:MAG: aminoglycoside N(3)-acetyltransferase [Culicoidibacterales bacterium]
MSEKKIITQTKTPVTIETLTHDFKKIGLVSGDVVLVHSSLSSLGWVCGGPQAVITALLEAVGDTGTTVMPAHSSQVSDPADWDNPPVPADWVEMIREQMPAFDLDATPTSGIGTISELFRTLDDSIRSNHPQTSFAANGALAEQITAIHTLTPQFGKNSPIGYLYKIDAKVLLLGVDFDVCSCFHMGEALRSSTPKMRMGAPLLQNGLREWVWFDDCDYDSDDFLKLGRTFSKTYPVSQGTVGSAATKLFSIRDAINYAKQWLGENRFDF